MQYSKNYNMNLPELADQFNVKQWNDNTEKIDTQMKANADAISAETSRAKEKENSLSSAISTETTRAKKAELDIVNGTVENANYLNTSDGVQKDTKTFIKSGVYSGYNLVDCPFNIATVQVVRHLPQLSDIYLTQIAQNLETGTSVRLAIRKCNKNVWSEWKEVAPIDVQKQMTFDVMFPVGKVLQQLPGEDSPQTMYNKNGITSTWQDITATYNGRFFKISTSNVGTTTAESLPNITGSFPMDVMFTQDTYAKPYLIKGALQRITQKIKFNIRSSSTQNTEASVIEFTASKKLNKNGSENPTQWTTVDNPAYQDNAKVQPDNVSIKLWKRTK